MPLGEVTVCTRVISFTLMVPIVCSLLLKGAKFVWLIGGKWRCGIAVGATTLEMEEIEPREDKRRITDGQLRLTGLATVRQHDGQ